MLYAAQDIDDLVDDCITAGNFDHACALVRECILDPDKRRKLFDRIRDAEEAIKSPTTT